MKTGIFDKNGIEITLGDTLRTFDRTGKAWIGKVVLMDNTKLSVKKDGEWKQVSHPQFALRTNYDTWLHPEQGNLYEILKEESNEH